MRSPSDVHFPDVVRHPDLVHSTIRIAEGVLRASARLGRVRVLAIDGPSGAGKSTLSHCLVDALTTAGTRVALISTDDFATWNRPAAWWPRLVEGVLNPLATGVVGHYRRMEWTTGMPRPGEWVTVPVPDVLVLEGVSAGRASMRPHLSRLCWVAGPDSAARLERAVARDGEADRAQLAAWQRFESGWFTVDRTHEYADDTVYNNTTCSRLPG